MKHLGDITKINGSEIPVVDIITGGSPCQDLSVAGLRKGIKHEASGDEETTRSGLFMDQLRIVKEMRANEMRNGRSGVDVRPRYLIWENVPGAFSVNGGKDFQAVLTEIARVIDPTAPDVPMPEKGGWPYAGCIYDELGRWSVAYRVHDAQFWGVPQRRRRIALVADFNGLSAAEILFDPQLRGEAENPESDKTVRDSGQQRGREVPSVGQGLSGHSEPSGAQGEGTPESPSGRSDGTGAISFQERAGKPGGARESSCRMSEQERWQASTANPCFSIQGNSIDRDTKMNGGGTVETPPTRSTQQIDTALLTPSIAETEPNTPFVNGTLQAKEQGMNLNSNNVVRVPEPDAFRTQATDGGTRATQQKQSALLGGRQQQGKPCSAATLTIRNPNGSTTEMEHGTAYPPIPGGAEPRRNPHKR